MPFSAGQRVLVVTLGRRGEVIDVRDRSYRVSVGGLMVSCREDELRGAEPSEVRKRKKPPAQAPPGSEGRPTPRPGVPLSLDLHGFTVEEAREALLRFLDAALLAGHATVEIVHGIGTGRVKAAVRRELGKIPVVRQVRPHPTNPGSTLVYL